VDTFTVRRSHRAIRVQYYMLMPTLGGGLFSRILSHNV
jgi:hypothetical protein